MPEPEIRYFPKRSERQIDWLRVAVWGGILFGSIAFWTWLIWWVLT